MSAPSKTLIDLEKKFWQSMVDTDTEAALKLLAEPSMMVSSHGAMKFDHPTYRRMAEEGEMVVTGYEMSDVDVAFPNEATGIVTYRVMQQVAARGKSAGATTQEMYDTSTWLLTNGEWRCVLHTETPAEKKKA